MSSALKQLSVERPTLSDLTRTMEEIETDHPRSAAILGSTYLEDATRLSLLTKMTNLSKSDLDKLFVGSAPLSSFSSKIELAYALGLMGKKARHDLHVIREIRNSFAHAKISITFDSVAITNAISGLHFKALSAEWLQHSNQRKLASVVRILMIYLIANWSQEGEEVRIIRSFDPPPEIGPISFED